MRRVRLLTSLAMAGVTLAFCSACTAPAPPSTKSAMPAPTPQVSPWSEPTRTGSEYPFAATTFWRTPITGAPVQSGSKAMIDYLVASIDDRYGSIAAFNAHQYNSPLYTAAAGAPSVSVRFDDCQGKGYVPDGLTGVGGQFTDVPVPADAIPAQGTDAEISIWSPSRNQLWEFWKFAKGADGMWQACWGGRIDDVATGDGRFAGQFGATATGLPNAGGVVRFDEIARGRIDHAISIAIPNPAAKVFSWPAQRTDGVDPDPRALPEGVRLRLDPSIDVTRLGLTPAGVTIARAAQQYGFVVVDRAGSVSVLAEAVPEEDGTDPWRKLLGGPDYAVLKNFPWSQMEVIRMDHGKPAS